MGKSKMANAQSRSRRDHALWDERVNAQWGGKRPKLSPDESLAAAKKLWRHATGKAWPGKWELTSGRRHTWPRYGTFYVNPDKGLRDIIHLVSHAAHRRLHPHDKPHSIRQVRLEAKLTKFAVARRWHEGTLAKQPKAKAPKAEPPAKPDKVLVRYRAMVRRRDKWAATAARAERLWAKANANVRAYERRYGERVRAQA